MKTRGSHELIDAETFCALPKAKDRERHERSRARLEASLSSPQASVEARAERGRALIAWAASCSLFGEHELALAAQREAVTIWSALERQRAEHLARLNFAVYASRAGLTAWSEQWLGELDQAQHEDPKLARAYAVTLHVAWAEHQARGGRFESSRAHAEFALDRLPRDRVTPLHERLSAIVELTERLQRSAPSAHPDELGAHKSKRGAWMAKTKQERCQEVFERVRALLDGERDWIAAMSTVACELHHSFEHYDWTGFYRHVSPQALIIGPYQGAHGCLHIAFERGVCGAAARSLTTQLVPDVEAFPDHIACSSATRSEIVVPVLTPTGELLAVLDVDSNQLAAFDELDQDFLEELCAWLGARFADTPQR